MKFFIERRFQGSGSGLLRVKRLQEDRTIWLEIRVRRYFVSRRSSRLLQRQKRRFAHIGPNRPKTAWPIGLRLLLIPVASDVLTVKVAIAIMLRSIVAGHFLLALRGRAHLPLQFGKRIAPADQPRQFREGIVCLVSKTRSSARTIA